ncbi:hypothetical protein MO973_12080 [Paenibacillus sp. TRM 82003]|nr:hypothetical protein [Paenibacillus sp. TRM 82003]
MTLPNIEGLLLQVLLALIPAFLMPILWKKLSERRLRVDRRLLIGLLCGTSLLLCMVFNKPLEGGYTFDLKAVPYIVGVLYGGLRIGLLVTLAYVGGRYWIAGPDTVFL